MWRFASPLQKTTFTIFFIFYLLANVVLMLFKEDLETSRDGFKAIYDGIKDFKNTD
jgi:hypothetical protein